MKTETSEEICTHEVTEKGNCIACGLKFIAFEDNSVQIITETTIKRSIRGNILVDQSEEEGRDVSSTSK